MGAGSRSCIVRGVGRLLRLLLNLLLLLGMVVWGEICFCFLTRGGKGLGLLLYYCVVCINGTSWWSRDRTVYYVCEGYGIWWGYCRIWTSGGGLDLISRFRRKWSET